MVKKVAKKKEATKTSSIKSKIKTTHNIDKRLIDNFVTLQKVIVNMSIKLDNLAGQLAKLLDLFEISAKSLAQKEFEIFGDNKETKEIREKIDNLFEQNKLIARGITLMNDKLGHETSIRPTQVKPGIKTPMPQMPRQIEHSQIQKQQLPRRPLPQQPQSQQPQQPQSSTEKNTTENFGNDLRGYEKSLSSEENNSQQNRTQRA